jgi:hypothetical protein
MSRSRNMADLLDSNGDVKSGALDNVPPADVVNDTTPQLGGDLASNGNDILFADNDKANFGDGNDLQIYHDPSAGHSYIKESGTGALKIQATNLELQDANGEYFGYFATNGAAELYYDNSEKFRTTSTGIDVTGTVTADAFDLSTDDLPSGTVVQCVTHTHSTAGTFSANKTETAISGYAVTITPKYSNSKILISGHIAHSSVGVTHKLVIKRNGTKIQYGVPSGSRQTALTGLGLEGDGNQARTAGWWAIDNPSTTSAVTYQMYTAADNSNALCVNRSPNDQNTPTGGRHISNIIAWEIAQ